MRWPENQAKDEVIARRAVREERGRAGGPGPGSEGEEPLPHFSWQDILAMIIAAYQVVLPIVLLFVGIMVLVYFLFRWWVL